MTKQSKTTPGGPVRRPNGATGSRKGNPTKSGRIFGNPNKKSKG